MLLEDKVEPLARLIAEFLDLAGYEHGSAWDRLPYRADEDLRPLKRTSDTEVSFVRTKEPPGRPAYEARLQLYDIREQEPDPSTIVFHPEIVLESTPKGDDTVVIDNYNSGSRSGPKRFVKSFASGESEADALSGAFKAEAWATTKASAEAGVEVGPASAKASVETETGFRTTLEAAWSRQTGRSRETKVSFESEEFAPPWTRLEQRLTWNEQKKQRRIECAAIIDCGIRIGRRRKHNKKWEWTDKSPKKWESIDHLIAVAEKRGSVKHTGYEHFSRLRLSDAALKCLDKIKQARKIPIDRLTEPYSGSADIRIQIVEVEVNPESTLYDDEMTGGA